MKWRYQVDSTFGSQLKLVLDQSGSDGWELVTVLRDSDTLHLIFKRPAA